jgi:osmotically inducible lipoprotein OsmB
MRSAVLAIAATLLALSAAACATPGERAAAGAGLAGAAVGAAATGRAGGALAGAAVGAAGGALVGAATAPPPAAFPCPYGTIRDAAGNRYCR